MSEATHKVRESEQVITDSRRAVTHLFAEYERARLETEAAEKRVARFAETIQIVLAGLSGSEKEELTKRFEEIRRGSASRAGDVNNNVISLFKKNSHKHWTVPEVHEALKARFTEIDSKAVANTIAYLAKTGRLTRISRGQYIYANLGIGIELDSPNDGSQRLSEHYD